MGQTLLGGGSPLNKFKEIETHLSRNSRTVYVELDGDDAKGDGSQSRPFSSVKQALLLLTGTTKQLNINLSAGKHVVEHDVFHKVLGTCVMTGSGALSVIGDAPMYVENAYLYIECGGIESLGQSPFVFELGPKGAVLQRCSLVCDNKASVVRFAYSGAVYLLRGAVTNKASAAVPLVSVLNGARVDVQKIGATLTNITE